MATKVKGDAIKEGSIPLSALSNEVKDKIENAGGGADWNAQADEVGYIENKPFGKHKVNGEIFDVCQNPLIRNIHYFIPYDSSMIVFEPSKKIDYIRVHWVDNDVVWIDETIKIPNDYITSVQTIKCVSETPLGSFNLDFEKTESEIRVYLTAQDELFSVRAESILGRIVVETITCLSDEYLPDNILKITPQTLSNTDKNQALANLGIPRVLNINIYGIEDNLTIDELSEIFGDCVTNEILILGLYYRTKYATVYLPTLHQSYTDFDGRKILNKLVCGQYRVDEDSYDFHLVVCPSVYLYYDEDTQNYRYFLEEY